MIVGISYYLVEVRRENKLDSCLDSMWSLYGNDNSLYGTKSELCFKEFGR
ncbi:MAG: hypothetical protein ACKKL6_00525 [Candidatus Komeilibacteria bacterium]